MHGANPAGRPFRGDHASIIPDDTLYRVGFARGPESGSAHDGLLLPDCRITNAVKCLPPQNESSPSEVQTSHSYLATELGGLRSGAFVLALGTQSLDGSRAHVRRLALRPRGRAQDRPQAAARGFLPLQSLQHTDPAAVETHVSRHLRPCQGPTALGQVLACPSLGPKKGWHDRPRGPPLLAPTVFPQESLTFTYLTTGYLRHPAALCETGREGP
jgi:hypothetical protein